MLPRFMTLIVLGLATPTWAQGLNPALEGSGTQQQSLELLDGALSVTIDSGGSLSLNRGADAVDANLGVTVNGLTIGEASKSQPASDNLSPEEDALSPSPLAQSAQPGHGQVEARPQSASLAPSPLSGAAACEATSVTPTELTRALSEQRPMLARELDCSEDFGSLQDLVQSHPAFFASLAQQGIASDQVMSITIDNGSVIVGHMPRR